MSMPQIVTADEAVKCIPDGSTVLVVPLPSEEIYPAFARVYNETGSPNHLTVVWAAGLGPLSTEPKGMNHFAVPGMVKRIIAGHMGLNHQVMKFVASNEVEAYNLPQGTMCQLYRDIAGGRPGLVTRVGLGTFIDPRMGGGKMNERTQSCEDITEVIEIAGIEYMFYRSFPCHVAVIRGTTADPAGNITMEEEALTMEPLEGAMAAKSHGGIVIAQVKRLSNTPAKPHEVKVPGMMVDYVVLARSPEAHPHTLFVQDDPSYSGQAHADLGAEFQPLPLNTEKVIARRSALELRRGMKVNLGFGIPMRVAQIAYEEGLFDDLTMTTEVGVIGGLPEGGKNFGPAKNPTAFISQAAMFDFYDGGGLDLTCVGVAQIDGAGNVNVSKVGPMPIGTGGFVNITQSARKLVFCGEFSAAGLDAGVENGKLVIRREGKARKFVKSVEQITFSGQVARQDRRDVTYVTERCVFKLVTEGLLLTEVAPGVDVKTQVLDLMDFTPLLPDRIVTMPEAIFREGKMQLL
jgi:propionate CoA-transferase